MERRGACIARLCGIAEEYLAAAASEDERRAQSSWTTTYDDDIEHAPAELQGHGHGRLG
jgi:hypothetical protein